MGFGVIVNKPSEPRRRSQRGIPKGSADKNSAQSLSATSLDFFNEEIA